MLVLGMASLASAVLVSGDSVTTDTVVWTVVGEQLIGTNATGVAASATIWIDGITGTWDNIAVGIGPLVLGDYTGSHLDASGNLGSVTSWAAGSFDASGGKLGEDLPAIAAGQWFAFDLSGEGTVGIGLYPSFTELGTITVTPEPMTMVLLGLGGLFLRRRK